MTANPILEAPPRGTAYASILQTIGHTPLVELHRMGPSPESGSRLFLKLEFFNPLSSVKDRIGLAMIEAAEQAGTLKPDTHIIEPTSGNTGIALAFVCAAKGYRLTLTMPESMSLERRALLRALGANLVLTPAEAGIKGAIEAARDLVTETDNAWMPQQFENPANPAVHVKTTGPEILDDLAGYDDGNGRKLTPDVFVAGVGTGGTITGVTRFLRDRGVDVKSFAVEPTESPVITQTLRGEEPTPGPHKIQGIGAGFVPRNLELDLLSGVEQVTNEQAFETSQQLAKLEGVMGGISTGANVFAARKLAESHPGSTVVTIGCSAGERYLSTPLFADLMN